MERRTFRALSNDELYLGNCREEFPANRRYFQENRYRLGIFGYSYRRASIGSSLLALQAG